MTTRAQRTADAKAASASAYPRSWAERALVAVDTYRRSRLVGAKVGHIETRQRPLEPMARGGQNRHGHSNQSQSSAGIQPVAPLELKAIRPHPGISGRG